MHGRHCPASLTPLPRVPVSVSYTSSCRSWPSFPSFPRPWTVKGLDLPIVIILCCKSVAYPPCCSVPLLCSPCRWKEYRRTDSILNCDDSSSCHLYLHSRGSSPGSRVQSLDPGSSRSTTSRRTVRRLGMFPSSTSNRTRTLLSTSGPQKKVPPATSRPSAVPPAYARNQALHSTACLVWRILAPHGISHIP